jgi:hypothetical protein
MAACGSSSSHQQRYDGQEVDELLHGWTDKVSCYCVLYVGEEAEVAALIWIELAKRRRILALLLIGEQGGRCEEKRVQ